MRFSLRINNDLPVDRSIELAQAAERLGFDQFWISNDLFLRSAPVLLAAVAAATRRIDIGSCILNPHTIHTAELAMMAATFDEWTGGRFRLGVAAGAADFLDWVGIADPKPVTTMRETLQALRRLLSGERAPTEGRFLRWSDAAYLRFAPPRATPLYLGAMGPQMLRLAGEEADGALPLLFPPEHFFHVRPLIEKGLAAAGRDPESLDLAACVWVSIAADASAARRALAEKVAYYGHSINPQILERLGLTPADFEPIHDAVVRERDMDKACALVTEPMLRIGVCGTAEELIERLEPLVEAGVRHLSFGPPLGPDPLQAVELLGSRVIPYFRD